MGHKSQFNKPGARPMEKATNGNGAGVVKFTEVEQTLLRNLNSTITKHRATLAEIQVQIMTLEEQRDAAFRAIRTASENLMVSVKEATKEHGVDLDLPNIGKWNVDFDTMTCTRTDV